jgi:hypothetical protein
MTNDVISNAYAFSIFWKKFSFCFHIAECANIAEFAEIAEMFRQKTFGDILLVIPYFNWPLIIFLDKTILLKTDCSTQIYFFQNICFKILMRRL